MKNFYLTSIALMACIFVSAQQLKYEILTDDPTPNGIANLYISPQFAFDVPFIGRMDAKGDATDAAALGFSLNIHSILWNKFIFDAHLFNGTMLTGLSGFATQKFDIGGGIIISERTEKKMMKVILERKETAVTREKTKIELKYIEMPGTEYKAKVLRGGLYIQRQDFNGDFDDHKARGVTNHVGVYAGISRARIANLHSKVGNYKYHKGVKSYGRLYADAILAPGVTTLEIGDKDNLPIPLPLGLRAGWDRYIPTTGLFSGNWRIEVGYAPGFNGFYTQMGIGFTVRAKVKAIAGDYSPRKNDSNNPVQEEQ